MGGSDLFAVYAAAIIGGLCAVVAAFMGGRYVQSSREDEEEAEVQRAIGRLEGNRTTSHGEHYIKIVEERVTLLHGTVRSVQRDLSDTREDIRENRQLLVQEQREIRALVTVFESRLNSISLDVGRLQASVRSMRGRSYPPHKREDD